MDISYIISHYKEIITHFFMIMAALGGFLKAIEAFLQFIAPHTGWKWDDNLATALGKFTARKIFNKPA